jgi:hypothetical protein
VVKRGQSVTKAVAAAERPTVQKPAASPIIMNQQILHSITSERLELIKGLGPYLTQHVRSYCCHSEVLASFANFKSE